MILRIFLGESMFSRTKEREKAEFLRILFSDRCDENSDYLIVLHVLYHS